MLISRIARMELILVIFLVSVSFFTNYEEFYRGSAVAGIIRYDIFLALAASLIQLLITFLIFVSWHNEEFRVRESEIVHRKGFFFNRENSFFLRDVEKVEYKRSGFEFMFNYGTIVLTIKDREKPFKIKSIENAEVYRNVIKTTIENDDRQASVRNRRVVTAVELILEGEGKKLEFKQTFRWDTKKKITSKDLEKAVLKTVTAFLNGDGGHLIIGVTDNGKIYGLDEDINSLVRKDRDGFENHFNQMLKQMIGAEFRQYVDLTFEQIEGRQICLIYVSPSPKPVYLRQNGDEEFFIRTGNTTSPLKVSEVNSYIESHWAK